MRLARRRTDEAPAPEPGSDPGAAPPRGVPVVEYAGLLDGQHLWVAIGARPGRLALRVAGSDELVPLPDGAAVDRPAYLSARLDLSALPSGDAAYDVVLVPPGPRSTVAVWTPPLAPRPVPTGTDSAGNHTQQALHRTPAGHLQVRVTTPPPAAQLQRVVTSPLGIDLTLTNQGAGHGSELALLDGEDTVLAAYPTTNDGDVVRATIIAAPLDGAPAQVLRVVLGELGAWLPVRRRLNDLSEPGRAAPMPPLYDGEAEEHRLRLRWSAGGLLQARVFDTDTGTDTDADTDADTGAVEA